MNWPSITFDELRVASISKQVPTEAPELWRRCYPRIYSEPKGPTCYYSPKDVGLQLAEIAVKIRAGYRGEAELYEFQIASELAKYRVPMFWITPYLMEAMRHTAPPSDFAWMRMPLPFEAAVFMVPKGTLQHKEEGDVRWAAYARFQPGHEEKSVLGNTTFGVSNGGMLLIAKTEAGLLHHWNMPADDLGEFITLADFNEYSKHLVPHTSSKGLAAYQITPSDILLFVEVAHYIFSTLLIMTERPEIVESGSLQKRVAKRGEVKEFWSPNVIGGRYRMHSEHGAGTHNSPRLHFVRGFWRQQVYGPQRSLRKPKWIEPFLRGEG